MKSGVYIYTNEVNGKKYVGQSQDVDRRIKEHIYRASEKTSQEYNSILHRAFRKYGIENFSIEKISCSVEEMNDIEVQLIEKYNTLFPNGYNIQRGGNYTSSPQKLSLLMVEEITDLLENSSLTGKEISEKYNVSAKMIAGINTGLYWKRDLQYPIRDNSAEIRNCSNCGKEITSGSKSGLCVSCSMRKRYGDNERPEPLELAEMIVESSFSEVGRRFGISDNAIKKWCKSYGIPHKKKELQEWYNKK